LVKPGLLEEEYAKMLEDITAFRKKVEHKDVKDISGAEVDEWIVKTEKYVDRFEKLLKDLELNRKTFDVQKNYEVMVKASVAALKSLNKLPKEPEKLPEAFKKYLVEAGLVSPFYSNVFEKVMTMKKMIDDKQIEKITDRDVYMSKEYVRRFIDDVRRFIDKPVQLPEGNVEDKVEKIEKVAESVKEVGKKKAKKK
jgi:DNA-binding ferritin-like protein (Dps family)